MKRRVFRAPLALALLLLLFSAAPLHAQRFEEGDWTAWGDARQVNCFSVGREYIYVGTSAGIYRFHRYQKTWTDPWYSVPTTLDRALYLDNVTSVFEDPLTLDLYVQRGGGHWVVREYGSHLWIEREPDPETKKRFTINGQSVSPNPAWIAPWKYDLRTDGTLVQNFLRWEYKAGIQDEFGTQIIAWKGFGLGVTDLYNNQVELVPLGPSSAVAMDFDQQSVWCTGGVDREGDLIWKLDLASMRWTFFHPDQVYELQPARINRLVISNDKSTTWFATDHGVLRYRNNDWKRIRKLQGLPSETVYDIADTPRGAWIATPFGLAMISEPSAAVFSPNPEETPLLSGELFSAVASEGNILYAGAPGILVRHDTRGSVWEEIEGPSFVAAASPPLALYAKHGQLAIGDREGFAWQDSTGWQEELSHKWRYGTVLSVEFHGGFWWLGTDRGLVRLNPETHRTVLYTREEGLVQDAVYAIHGDRDYLWLGTEKALVRFRWKRQGRID